MLTQSCGSFPAGTIGKIVEDDGSKVPYLVAVENGSCLWAKPDALTPMSSGSDTTRSRPRERKVGDKVRIKSREWYEANKDESGIVRVPCGFTEEMARFCGKTLTITRGRGVGRYALDGGAEGFTFTEDMFEDDSTTPLGLIRTKRLLTHIKLD